MFKAYTSLQLMKFLCSEFCEAWGATLVSELEFPCRISQGALGSIFIQMWIGRFSLLVVANMFMLWFMQACLSAVVLYDFNCTYIYQYWSDKQTMSKNTSPSFLDCCLHENALFVNTQVLLYEALFISHNLNWSNKTNLYIRMPRVYVLGFFMISTAHIFINRVEGLESWFGGCLSPNTSLVYVTKSQ